MDHCPPSEGQAQPLSVDSSSAQLRGDNHLWGIPNCALVRTQPSKVTEIQLDLAQLPHVALDSLNHTILGD